tara:strand:+ start:43 stop:612 length:570 start_codon:yes stop_codon:yes gene_type:complete
LENNTKQFGIITILIVLATLSRLIDHPANFVPISAMILFGAAHFEKKWQVFLIPFGATLLSDMWLSPGFINIGAYISYGLILLFGIKLYSRKISASNMLSGAIGSGLIFFIVSNFMVWMMDPIYMNVSKTSSSLVACYIDGLLFHRGTSFFLNTLISNLFYSTILFGSYYALQTKFEVLKLQHIKYRIK